VAATVIGNTFEWYDFVVYSYLATIIAKNFFPAGNDALALLQTFGVFGLGFVARPLGAVVIGWFADRKGRKAALILTILLMAVGTLLIGVIPSYAAIGALAPGLLVLARLVQGFSVGGEWGGSATFIVEWAPNRRRGFLSSLQQCSVVAGLLLGSGVAALLSTLLPPDAMQSWGWRLPFLLGGLIAPVGIYMRSRVDETPAFRQSRSLAPADTAWQIPQFVQAFGLMIVSAVQFYIFLAYMPTFTQAHAGLTSSQALWANTAGLLFVMLAIPVLGLLSDGIGRKPLLAASCIIFILLPYPLFRIMLDGASLATVLAIQLLVALGIAAYSAALPSAIAEIFSRRARTTHVSIANGTAVAIFGGFAPFIATWLIQKTGSPISPTYFVIAAAILSLLAVVSLPETARRALR
jgi:MHS family proline/betaine transporter-like MFS transporter